MKKVMMCAAMFAASVCFGTVANAQSVAKKETKKECCQQKDSEKKCEKAAGCQKAAQGQDGKCADKKCSGKKDSKADKSAAQACCKQQKAKK